MYSNREAAVGDCTSRGRVCRLWITGYSWTQVDTNIYKRFILRRCIRCGMKEAEPLFRIDPTRDFCSHCGSQHYTATPVDEDLALLTCQACGRQQHTFVREPQDGNV